MSYALSRTEWLIQQMKQLEPTFLVVPLMRRTVATAFSPEHLSACVHLLPVDVVLANLYYHIAHKLISVERDRLQAFDVCICSKIEELTRLPFTIMIRCSLSRQ